MAETFSQRQNDVILRKPLVIDFKLDDLPCLSSPRYIENVMPTAP